MLCLGSRTVSCAIDQLHFSTLACNDSTLDSIGQLETDQPVAFLESMRSTVRGWHRTRLHNLQSALYPDLQTRLK